MRTSDCLEHAFQQRTRGFGLTPTQYNVLRILRGAQPCGLPCAAIGARMIAAEPDITRLLGRLKRLKLIRQHRDRHDRRVVLTQISDSGLELLRAMDPLIERITVELLGGLERGGANRNDSLAGASAAILRGGERYRDVRGRCGGMGPEEKVADVWGWRRGRSRRQS